MGYLYLSLALVGGLVKGFAGKKISNDVRTFKDCCFVNFLRVLFCALIAGGLCLSNSEVLNLEWSHLPIYLFSAVAMTAFCVTFMFGYKTAAYMYLSIFGMLGAMMAGVLGSLVYNEPMGIGKWVGMLLLLAAVAVMTKYNKTITRRETRKVLPLLLIAAVSVALSDFSQKIFVYEIGGDAAAFNFYTYAFAAILLVPLILLSKGSLKKESPALLKAKNVLICFLIAGALFLNSYSKTLAAGFLSAAEIYPVLQGANLIASAVLARILLKEAITLRCMIGMTLAFIGLLIMNFC